jgi:hypothetical protein
MTWVSYGRLSCFQSFRTAEDTEAFNQTFDLFEQSLQRIGFDYVQPGYIQSNQSTPHGPEIGFIHAAWRRTLSSDEDLIAVGLQSDDTPGFDYLASVKGSNAERAQAVVDELRKVDVELRRELRRTARQRRRAEMADVYARRMQVLLALSPIAATGVYVLLSGALASYLEPGLASSTKGLLFWIPYAAAAFAALYAFMVFFYLVSLGWTDVRERLRRHH